jgi:hypothetical protein
VVLRKCKFGKPMARPAYPRIRLPGPGGAR